MSASASSRKPQRHEGKSEDSTLRLRLSLACGFACAFCLRAVAARGRRATAGGAAQRRRRRRCSIRPATGCRSSPKTGASAWSRRRRATTPACRSAPKAAAWPTPGTSPRTTPPAISARRSVSAASSASPGRLHITWDNDNTLKMEFDAGQQTRLLHFDKGQPPAEKTWQGYSAAEWDIPPAGGRGAPGNAVGAGGGGIAGGGGGGGGGGCRAARGGGRGRRVDEQRRPAGCPARRDQGRDDQHARGLLAQERRALQRERGHHRVRRSAWARSPTVRSTCWCACMVDDPKYLNQPFVTSTHFRLEPDGASKWNPYTVQDRPARDMTK